VNPFTREVFDITGRRIVKQKKSRLKLSGLERGKVKFFLSGAEVYFRSFLPSALGGDIVVPLLSSHFTASKRISSPQYTGEWANLFDGLDILKDKCLAHIVRPNFSTQSIFTITTALSWF